MLTDYAAAGGQELWNTTRLQAYLTNVGSPFDTGADICHCPTLTPEVLGHTGPYTTPNSGTDPAPWYDTAVPESAEFLGFLPLSIDGIDDSPYGRTLTNSVGGGGVFGPSRAQPRTMTVSGVIIGSTCCGAAYGLYYLTEMLAGTFRPGTDPCGACAGEQLTMYNCCPDPGMTAAQFNAAYRRTFRRTALTSGPTVTRRTSTGDCARSSCAAGAELIDIEFVLVATVPWAWRDAAPVLDVPILAATNECIDWCPSLSGITCGGEPCLFQDCDTVLVCQDPASPVVTPPKPTLPLTSFCIPLVADRTCYTLDLSGRPAWAEDYPLVTLNAGFSELHNIRVTFYEKATLAGSCDTAADAEICEPTNDFYFTFVPNGGSTTVDGPIGRAYTECTLDPCFPASTVFGSPDGGPLKVNGLKGDYYCVCIEVDSNYNPAADATLTISLVGRGY